MQYSTFLEMLAAHLSIPSAHVLEIFGVNLLLRGHTMTYHVARGMGPYKRSCFPVRLFRLPFTCVTGWIVITSYLYRISFLKSISTHSGYKI